MPSFCVVPQCGARGNSGFYRFPADMREKWAQIISVPLDRLTKTSTICSKHFLPSDYVKKRLKNQSVPSLNLPVSQFLIYMNVVKVNIVCKQQKNVSSRKIEFFE